MRPACSDRCASKVNLTRLMQYSAKLCETIVRRSIRMSAAQRRSIRLASSDARWEEFEARANCGEELRL